MKNKKLNFVGMYLRQLIEREYGGRCKDFANKTNVSKGYISNIINGNTEVSFKKYYELCLHMGSTEDKRVNHIRTYFTHMLFESDLLFKYIPLCVLSPIMFEPKNCSSKIKIKRNEQTGKSILNEKEEYESYSKGFRTNSNEFTKTKVTAEEKQNIIKTLTVSYDFSLEITTNRKRTPFVVNINDIAFQYYIFTYYFNKNFEKSKKNNFIKSVQTNYKLLRHIESINYSACEEIIALKPDSHNKYEEFIKLINILKKFHKRTITKPR